jgi:glycosyltransferase involved in cell wall biosynthesis
VNGEKAVLLLGRRDGPIDGVADYCEKLREAGAASGIDFEVAGIPWDDKGWKGTLDELRAAAVAWRDRWVFLQYTTLAWSRRGFPLRAPRVLDILRQCGARPAVVLHDFMPARGSGIVGRARASAQLLVLRQLYARSKLTILTVPADNIPWLPPQQDRAVFIPVGSNFPQVDLSSTKTNDSLPADRSTVAIFGITGGAVGAEEVGDITYALKAVQSRGIRVRLIALGRGSQVFEKDLREALNGSDVEFSMLGVMSAEELVRALAAAQVLLCVRGHVSSRRGSAIAGIACGLPIVGYRGPETGYPVTEAGVKLVDLRDREGLVDALAQVLRDEKLYRELRQRSAGAAQKYFCWTAIASQFASAMAGRKVP